LELPAEACVFVDDQWRNIEGAQKFGMNTIHFDVAAPKASYQAAMDELVSLQAN
jgi:putative hydrolase of the HAD superfamily